MERRRQRRVSNLGAIESFSFQGENAVVEIDRPLEISLKDMSVGGLGIKSKTKFDIDTTLSIDLMIESDNYVVIGKIVWCKSNGAYYDCGLKLIYMPDELAALLDSAGEETIHYPN
jgi:hypothetical protein